MDYEKKYRELVEAIKVLKETNPSDEGIQNWVNDNVPELKEGKDERIREKVIATIHLYYGEPLEDEAKEMIAWLEKQGEQILANSVKTCKDEQKPAENKGMNLAEENMTPFQKKVFCIIDTTIEEEQGLKQVCDELLRLAHDEIKQKPAWSEKHIADVFEKVGLAKIVREQSNDALTNALQDAMIELSKFTPQPKQEWSEEDRIKCNGAIHLLENLIKEEYFDRDSDDVQVASDLKFACKGLINWLKSLKERVLPRQKWSEDDMKKISWILAALQNSTMRNSSLKKENEDAENWLKSLKDRYTWKPSEEQMDALEDAIACAVSSIQMNMLNSLYQDLKKLKG